jgi:Dolichyl-phosphate-mannose-protein mannosyltransferase
MNVFCTNLKKPSVFCLLLVIGCAGALDVIVAISMSATYDEPQSVAYGERILHSRPDRSELGYDSKSPIAALNAIPRVIADRLDQGAIPPSVVRVLRSIRFARLASILAILILNVFVYCWASALYGTAAAIAVSILVVFSPNLMAHGTLATNDGPLALGVVGSLYFFRRYLIRPTLTNTVVSGFVLALAQLTKPFALYLYPTILVFLVLVSRDGKNNSPVLGRKELLVFLFIACVCFLVVINAGFCFDRVFSPLKSYHFDSASFMRLQAVPVLRSVPLPLPYPFLQGFDMLKHNDSLGLTYGKIYLLGELRDPSDPNIQGFRTYYAVVMLFKEPIPIQILCLLGLVWICRNRNYREFITGEGLLLASAILLFLWFSLFRRSQLGIRSILPVVAIEVIIAGAAFFKFAERSRRTQIALSLLVLWMCVSTMTYYPNVIPYVNEWVFDRKQSYKLFADSNLDFGQERDLVRDFLTRNPDVVLDPEKPEPGRVLVSVNHLVGVWRGYKPMDWLLRYKPVSSVGYGHLLYFVPPQDVAREKKD